MIEALWKRYPKRSGAARFQPFYTVVEVLESEIRKVPKTRVITDPNGGPTRYERIEVSEEYAKVRVDGRTRWVPSKDLRDL